MPNDKNRFVFAAPFADLRPRRCLSSALARCGCANRIHRARQTVLRLLGCVAEETAMTTAVAGARAVDEGEGAQGVVVEEVRELRLALYALTCRVRTTCENIEFIAKAICSSADELV